MQNGVQLEHHVMLTDSSMTPLSLLPLHMPKAIKQIMGNYTSPMFTRINETVSITLEHKNETSNGTYDYSQFVYFVDLPVDLP